MDKSAEILIVDDYLLIRTAIRGVLAELGFDNVHQAENGKAAQDLMRKQHIDIVIGDWGMPVMNGMDLLKWMRREEKLKTVPFMMVTAEANPDSVRVAMQAGVNAFLVKPFTVHSFASKFMGMLGPVGEKPGSYDDPNDIDQLARTARQVQLAPKAAPAKAPAAKAAPAKAPAAAPAARAPAPAPAQVPADPRKVIGLERPIAERVRRSTILIVDDIATNIEVLAGALKDEYALKVAITGKKAIEIAQSFQIDLILLDIMMPVMDGYEVCRQLKANPATEHIPVIFLSARDGADDVVAGLRLGAVDYVSKPVDPTILKARLSTHLTLATAFVDLKKQNALLTENAHLREDVERMTQHDLKGPMSVVLQGSQALLASDLSQTQRESAQMIEMAANNALEMVNRTLDVYKMETGTYQATLQLFDLGALVHNVALQVEMAFAWKNVTVSFPGGFDGECLGEQMLCYSLFSNLLKNAMEAAPEGSRIVVEVAPGYGSTHVVVDNEGEVPAALHATFFDKYATMNKDGGTGLGTYSVKLMAEVQAGSVSMQSIDGHTRITVTLPNA
jgi:two-component system sensor histidine kinase/response regulator